MYQNGVKVNLLLRSVLWASSWMAEELLPSAAVLSLDLPATTSIITISDKNSPSKHSLTRDVGLHLNIFKSNTLLPKSLNTGT